MMNAREIALRILHDVEAKDAYSDLLYTQKIDSHDLSGLDKAFLKQIVNGTIKMRLQLDWILNQFLKSGVESLTVWIRNILRLGLYQILFLDRVPNAASTNEAVNLAKKYGHRGTVRLVNGVLRNIIRNRDKIEFPDIEKEPVQHISVRYSHPAWLIRRWIDRLGIAETIQRCAANNLPAPNTIRANTLTVNPIDLKQALEKEGFTVSDTLHQYCFNVDGKKSLQETEAFANGWFYFQDATFALISQLTGASAKENILDICAAPGGKTTHMAQMMNNQGEIIAVDSNSARLSLVEENCVRLGVDIVKTVTENGEDYHPNKPFDRILIDAPCSDIGVWRRRADARWRMTETKIGELAAIQHDILENAASLVVNGGTIVYSTCTTEPEENEYQIERFLSKHDNFSLEHGKYLLPAKLITDSGYFSTSPHNFNMDGAFAVRIRRNR